MGRISIEGVAAAISKIGAMSTSEQLALCDEISQTQPNMLASCLVQNTLGVGNGGLEHTIKMMLVCYQAMKESSFTWPVISEDEQELHMQRMAATINFSKSFRSDKQSNRATQKFLGAHPEQPLLAYVLAECTSWLRQISERQTEAETDKYPLMASLNFVNCIAHVEGVTRRG
jgi:hypothetical protein